MTQITTTYIDHMGSDLSVVNAARVSFGKSHAEFDPVRDTKLIKYLAKHKHISPFGHAFASFHIKAPIFVARQLVKHKFLRWNEISRRYVDDTPEFYVPDVWRGRSADKKQGSDGVVEFEDHYEEEMALDKSYYEYLLYWGVAPEQARMVLPQSTMTEWYWSGSLDAFADMCRLRCKEDTQYESRLVADQVSTIMQDLYPVSWAALMGENSMTERLTTWHNVYPDGPSFARNRIEEEATLSSNPRICVYRIERDADGGNPEIFVEKVEDFKEEV